MRQRSPTREATQRALGALAAFAGGFLAYSLLQAPTPTLLLTIQLLLTIGLASLIGALLWRAWRALLVVPVALWLGAVAAAIVFKALASAPIAGPGLGATVILALDLLLFFGLPAAVASAVGVAAGMRLERH
ncbi:MAG TPA: hypothetical protein VFQ25_10105 [Ktedonobacterales bacterium]|nr:hypothetical protein [Ktedonobacterales bacterium]